jgi:hypothetical protein
LDSSRPALVTIDTLPNLAAFSANVKPAIPEPITRKSVLFFIYTSMETKGKYTNRILGFADYPP